MNVTTVHGIICMDNPSNDHSSRDNSLPVPHRHCYARYVDIEGERQYIVFMACESRPADYHNRAHPWFSCNGVVPWMVGTCITRLPEG